MSESVTPEESQETTPAGEQHAFQTEIQQLLDLMIHSLYSNEEIFLRELISNASDALNKIQFEQLTAEDVVSADAELSITVDSDRDAKTITIQDTGVGMSREELIKNLGTIAHSGSKAFLQALKDKEGAPNESLIGQFGVGFYSAFMVADRVEVQSRSFRADEEAVLWSSEGAGTYTIAAGDKAQRGTTITIHLKEDKDEYLDLTRLENIVKKYSDFVSFPIYMDSRVVNRQKALWQESKENITEEQYHEFYGHMSHDTRKPLKHLHLAFEAPLQFNAILYIPPSAPDTVWTGQDGHKVNLFAKRVFIQENCEELLPKWLRFVIGVVDSADLPLNVSRETIQHNPLLGNIKNNLTRKLLGTFKQMAKDEEAYKEFWQEFSRYLKQGYVDDFGNREKLVELLRFNSSHFADADGLTSLKTYVERMREGQSKIYYAHGDSREAIERSPNLEALKSKGFEVLYMSDPIDALLMSWLNTYDEKEIQGVDSANIDLDDKKEDSEEDQPNLESTKDLAEFAKKVLGDRVEDVRLSKRLVSSPVCLVNPENALASDLQRLYKMMDKDFVAAKKILELNPNAPLIADLTKMYDSSRGNPTAQEGLRPWVEQLHDMAMLAEGVHPDPAAMVPRMQSLLSQAAAAVASNAPEAVVEEAVVEEAVVEEVTTASDETPAT